MEKIKVTQDVLYQYLTEHNVNISGLAREMGANATFVSACFKHTPDRMGRERCFTLATLPRLNEALERFAAAMRQSLVSFGSDQTFTNNRGTTYDPGTLPALKNLSQYFNLTALTARVLGWNKFKKSATISQTCSIVYGCVKEDDVTRINAELLAVSGVLSNYEVIADQDK